MAFCRIVGVLLVRYCYIMFNLMRSQPVRLASAAARAFSTTAEVYSIFTVLFNVLAALFVVLFKVSISGPEAKW